MHKIRAIINNRTLQSACLIMALLSCAVAIVATGAPAVNTDTGVSAGTRPAAVYDLPVELLQTSLRVNVTTDSQTIADLIGTSLHADAMRVQVINRDTTDRICISATGAATTANAGLNAGENIIFREAATDMATHELIATDSPVAADILIWIWRQN